MSSTFTPPSRPLVPPILPETRGLQRKLWRHYRTRYQGVNVYIRDGVVTEVPPTGYETTLRVFYGGHAPEAVTAAEAALLVAAGYTVDSTQGTWSELTGAWEDYTVYTWGGF